MSEVEHLLDKLKYRDLLKIAKDQKMEGRGKKKDVVAQVLEKLDEDAIREYYNKFSGSRLNITHHGLVPKHEVLSKEKAQEMLKSFHCSHGSLPKIMDTDPMILKIKARAGDIIKITRRSPTAGEAYYYRLVVKSI